MLFQNEKRVFVSAHHAFKQVALIATRGGTTPKFLARFRMGVGNSPQAQEIPDDLLRNDSQAMAFTPDDVRRNSPKTLSLVELSSPRHLAIFRKVYDQSFRVGDNVPGWEITYVREFDMTNDSKHFPPLEKWEAKGYRPDVFGRWIGPDGDVALPVYQGIMFHQFECGRAWYISGAGKRVIWEDRKPDNFGFRSQFLMASSHNTPATYSAKLVMRDVSNPTNRRTMITSLVPDFPCIHKVPRLRAGSSDNAVNYALLGVTNSLTFDSIVRIRFSPSGGGGSIPLNVIVELPLPGRLDTSHCTTRRVVHGSARLALLHRRFAPEWLKLRHLCRELSEQEWKHWWAVTEADRLRLRVEIDALCADLYGLDPDDFDWIVRDDRTDSKGFYRVDRDLPFRERLTGLAAAAFQALKDGKWSAESAANLTNDEFFDILGIPELTNPDAAKRKGLPGPLILKRDGCHVWKPENFPPDDPRHGWTWDDCWKDAVALLGSEEAVRKYIEGEPQAALTPGPSPKGRGEAGGGPSPASGRGEKESAGPKDLFGSPIPTDLFGNEIRKKRTRRP